MPQNLRTFGRTASRMSVAEQTRLDERLEPYSLALPPLTEAGLPQQLLDARSLFGGAKGVKIEIGIGNGLALFERAKAEPDYWHVGVEVYKNGLRSLVHKLEVADKEGQAVNNLRVCGEDARRLLEALPPESVDELIVLYPDPWPKRRHHKRRLIQNEFLDMAACVLRPGGTLFMATDISDYAFWMLRHVLAHEAFTPEAASPEEWALPPRGWVSTKYEQKAIAAGRSPWYLTFRKLGDETDFS